MNNYKMTIAYDGTRYKGWQKLGENELTIQGILEKEISDVLGGSTPISGSGRTDAGVHALGQVANMRVKQTLSSGFFEKLDNSLPEDIRIVDWEMENEQFHSRYSAQSKCYSYSLDIGERPSVFQRKYVYHYPQKLDIGEMQRAAALLKGTHDFSAFTDWKSEQSKVRTIHNIRIDVNGTKIKISYQGDGFMQHMVRILTGTLLEVGTGIRSADTMQELLKCKVRAEAGFLVPAKGLCLEKVYY